MADNAQNTDTEVKIDLARMLSSVRLEPEVGTPVPLIQDNLQKVVDDGNEKDWFLSGLAAILFNLDQVGGAFDRVAMTKLCSQIDQALGAQLDEILHAPQFQALEAPWRSFADLVEHTNFKANISLSILDVSKEEAFQDLEMNASDISGSELFKKVYVSEYDQFGGQPYGGIVGLYEFANTPKDILWLKSMGKIATTSHAPFVSAVSPKFFGCSTMKEVTQFRDIDGLLSSPKYSAWNAFRQSEVAAYIGLTLPRYICRVPYNSETNPVDVVPYEEGVRGDDDSKFVWGNTAMLFARNLVRSFETSGWCQYIRGPRGGGSVSDLPAHTFNLKGEDEVKHAAEICIPDYREYEFAKAGLIPLVAKKGSADAVFFSAQSIKKSETFKDPKDSENSQLVTNLAYTYSISRIAHYVKCIMRDNIGSSADSAYVKTTLEAWISKYITTTVNPSDLTLRYYPFKAYSLNVDPVPGKVGWYHCNMSVLPHIQFEGMDVDMRIDARLG